MDDHGLRYNSRKRRIIGSSSAIQEDSFDRLSTEPNETRVERRKIKLEPKLEAIKQCILPVNRKKLNLTPHKTGLPLNILLN